MTRVQATAITHIADWARACGADDDPNVSAFLLAGEAGRSGYVTPEIADWLYHHDGTSHGYSRNRALCPTRTDCELCRRIGEAIAAETTRPTTGLAWGTPRRRPQRRRSSQSIREEVNR